MRNFILIWACCMVQQAYSQQFIWEKKYTYSSQVPNTVQYFDYDRGSFVMNVIRGSNSYAGIVLAKDNGDTIWTRSFNDTLYTGVGEPIKFHKGKAYYFPMDYKSNTDTINIAMLQIDKLGTTKLLNTYHFKDYVLNNCISKSIAISDDNTIQYLGECGNNKIPGNVNFGGWKAGYTMFDTVGTVLAEQFYPYNDFGYISMLPSTLFNLNDEVVYYASGCVPGICYPFLMKIKKEGIILDSGFVKELANDYSNSDIRNGYGQFEWGQMIYDQEEHLYLTGVFGWVNAQKQARGKYFIAKIDTNFNFKWVLRCSGENEKGSLAQSRMNLLPNGNILLSGFEVGNTGLRIYNIRPDGVILDSIRLQSQITTGKGYRYITHSHYFAEDSTLAVSGQLDGTAYLAKVDLKKFLLLNMENDAWAGNAFSVSPNPCANYLHLQIPKQGTLELYNVQGQLVQKQKIIVNMTEVDISQLNTGSYMYRFLMEDGVKYGKIVKE